MRGHPGLHGVEHGAVPSEPGRPAPRCGDAVELDLQREEERDRRRPGGKIFPGDVLQPPDREIVAGIVLLGGPGKKPLAGGAQCNARGEGKGLLRAGAVVVHSPAIHLHRDRTQRGDPIHQQEHILAGAYHLGEGRDVGQRTGGRLRVDHRDGVHIGAFQKLIELLGRDRGPGMDLGPVGLPAAGLGDAGQVFPEVSARGHQHPVAHPAPDGRLEQAGSGRGGDEDRLPGAEAFLERGLHGRQHGLHPRAPVPEHRLVQGGEHVGMDVGRAGKKVLSEPAHAASTLALVTKRTPRAAHSANSPGAASGLIARVASVTRVTEMPGRWRRRPSMAYLSHTSSATPYSTTSEGASASSTGSTFGLVKTSNQCLWKRISPSWARTRAASAAGSASSGSMTSGFRSRVSAILAWPGVPRMQGSGKVVTQSGVPESSRWPASWSSALAMIRIPFRWAYSVSRASTGMMASLSGTYRRPDACMKSTWVSTSQKI